MLEAFGVAKAVRQSAWNDHCYTSCVRQGLTANTVGCFRYREYQTYLSFSVAREVCRGAV